MLVVSEYKGCSTMSLTPTAAAQVDNNVAGPDSLVHGQFVQDRPLPEGEPGVVAYGVQVGQAPRRQRVEHADLVAIGQQGFDQVRADKPRPASNQETSHSDEGNTGFSLDRDACPVGFASSRGPETSKHACRLDGRRRARWGARLSESGPVPALRSAASAWASNWR